MLRQRVGWGGGFVFWFFFWQSLWLSHHISMSSTSTDVAVWVHSSSAWQQPASVQPGQTEVASHHQVRIRITYATRLFQAWLYIPLCSDVESNMKRQIESQCVYTMNRWSVWKMVGRWRMSNVARHWEEMRSTAEIKGWAPGIHPHHRSFHHCCLFRDGNCLQFRVRYGVRNKGRQGRKIKRSELNEEEQKKTWRANRLLCWGQQKLE